MKTTGQILTAEQVLDGGLRKEIGEEMYRVFCMVAGRVSLHFDPHVINILVFPRTGTQFTVPGGPVSGVIRDPRGYTERE